MAEFNLQIGIDASGARRGANQVREALAKVEQQGQRTNRGIKKNERQLKSLGQTMQRVTRLATAFAGAFVLRAAFRQFTELSDAFTNFNNRLKIVTKSEKERLTVQAELIRQAKSQFTSLESLGEVFQRVSKGAGEAGISQLDALKATEAVAAAVRLSGVSAEAARNAIVQFGQGLAAGAIRGDELRSVLEQTPELANTLADIFGITVGKLRAFGAEGKILTSEVIPGLAERLDDLRARTALLEPTFSQAFENLKTDLTVAVGDLAAVTGATSGFAKVLTSVSGIIPNVADALAILSVNFGELFDLGVSIGGGISLAFDEITGAVLGVIPAAEGLGDTFLELVGNTIPNAILLIKLAGTEIVSFFATTETGIRQMLNNFKLATQQRAGDVEGIKATRLEMRRLNMEAEIEAGFREDNIRKILDENKVSKEKRLQLKAQLAAEREARKERLKDLADLANTTAGGAEDGTGGNVTDPLFDQDDIDKFNAAHDAAFAFRQEMEEIQGLAAAGASKTAVDKATADAAADLKEALTGISQDDITSFNEANDASAAYAARLAEIAVLAAEGAGQDAIAAATAEAREEYEEATGALDAYNDALKLSESIIDSTITPQEELTKSLAEAQERLEQGFISDEVFQRYKKQLEDAAGQTDFLRDISKAAAEDIQGAFRDMFLEGTDSLDDFANHFGETLRRVAANFLANQAIRFLLGDNFGEPGGEFGGVAGGIAGLFTGGNKGVQDGGKGDSTPFGTTIGEANAPGFFDSLLANAPGIGEGIGQSAGDKMNEAAAGPGGLIGAIGSLFGSIGGAVGGGVSSAVGGIASLFAGGLAGGGDIGRNQFAVVGENGPEIATGPATITPMGGGMPAPEVNVNIANITDPREAVVAVGDTNAGAKGVVNQISSNVEEIQRVLGIA